MADSSKPETTSSKNAIKSLPEVLELMFMGAQAMCLGGNYKPDTIPTLVEETIKMMEENNLCKK